MKNKKIIFLFIIALSIFSLVACTQNSKEDQNSLNETNQDQQENNLEQTNDADEKKSSDLAIEEGKNEDIQEDNKANEVTKIEGRKNEFIERLDNIQKELDALPEKKDSDAGVTNAMKNYYGRSYEMYDEELNEIYALLKKELSPETMEDLKTKQLEWIDLKEKKAYNEESKYKGKTFEFVAGYISLYESTKERCYELVNEYMTE